MTSPESATCTHPAGSVASTLGRPMCGVCGADLTDTLGTAAVPPTRPEEHVSDVELQRFAATWRAVVARGLI